MHYIERDSSGRIIRVAAAPFVGMTEEQQDFTPEMDEWLKNRTHVPRRCCNFSAAIWKWFAYWKI